MSEDTNDTNDTSDTAAPLGTDLAAKHYADKSNVVPIKSKTDQELNNASVVAERQRADAERIAALPADSLEVPNDPAPEVDPPGRGVTWDIGLQVL